MCTDIDKHRRRWTGPEKVQAVVAVLSLLLGIIALIRS